MTDSSKSSSAMRGIVPALVTPFDANEGIDYGAWTVIIDTLIAAKIDGLFATGGQGEFFSLEDDERAAAMRFCKRATAGRVPVYGNVGCITTRASIKLAQRAEADGVDYLVVITPFFVKPTADELVVHYTEICRAVHSPVLAYTVPDRTGVDLSPAIIARIASKCQNFVGVKDSSGKLEQLRELLGGEDTGQLAVFMGRDNLFLEGLKLGCVGTVTACANVAPALFVELYRAFQRHAFDEATRVQNLINQLRAAVNLHTFPSVVKAAMELAGLPAGPCRKPVGPLPAEIRAQVSAIVDLLRAERYIPERSVMSSRSAAE